MGDAEVGAVGWDGVGEGGAGTGGSGGSSAMSGGSLPPRKRLLAGLKQQNGGWLPATSPSASVVAPPASVVCVDGGVERVKTEEGCISCSVLECHTWRRIKRSGVFHRLCNPCAQLFTKNMCCPYCLVGYHEFCRLGDPAVWLLCSKCGRSVHVECELKQARVKVEAAAYACPDCSQPNRRLREAGNGYKGKAGFFSRVAANAALAEAGQCMASAECSSPSNKKARMSREPRSRPVEGASGAALGYVNSDRGACVDSALAASKAAGMNGPARKTATQHPSPISPEENAAAARAAAAAAIKAATAAKATAAAKAALAVKAAAAAKAALETAALAARAEAQARAELRRSSGRSDARGSMTSKLTRESCGNSDKDKVERSDGRPDRLEVKMEKEDSKGLQSPMDDGELARQLHREMNSSPRISRSLTPSRGKAGGRLAVPGASPLEAGARAWPRTGTPTEPRSQHKYQQTRPRSFVCKDGKRTDMRVHRSDYKKADDEMTGSGVPSSNFEEDAFNSLELEEPNLQAVDVKPEPVLATGYNRDECFAQDTSCAAPLIKPEPDVYSTTDSIQDHRVACDAGIPSLVQGGADIPGHGGTGPDIVMDGDFRVDGNRWEQQNEALSLMATLIAEEEDYRDREQEMEDQLTAEELAHVSNSESAQEQNADVVHAVNNDHLVQVDGVHVDKCDTGEYGVAQAPLATTQDVSFQLVSPHPSGQEGEPVSEVPVCLTTPGSPRPMAELAEQRPEETTAAAEPDTLPDEIGLEPSRNGTSDNGSRSSPIAVAGHGEPGGGWHPTKLKGLSPGGPAFAGGVSLPSFGPSKTMSVRTPAVASGATGRHV